MVKRIMIVFVLCISLMALLGTQADAKVCIGGWYIGKCLLWSGTLTCDIGASGLGNCSTNQWELGCSITASGDWVLACGNPGSKTWASPGIQLIQYSTEVSSTIAVTTEMCDANGNAAVEVNNGLSQDQLAQLNTYCPNPNWTAIDAVPCHATQRDQQFDANGCVVADATFDCVLPDCASLQWTGTTFEKRQYDCTRTSYNVYKDACCNSAPCPGACPTLCPGY